MATKKNIENFNGLFEVVISLLATYPKTLVYESRDKGNTIAISRATHGQAATNLSECFMFKGNIKEATCYMLGVKDILTECIGQHTIR